MRNIIDHRYLELLSTLDFIAPGDYNPSLQLLNFKQKYEKDFYWFDKLMTDEDCKATHLIEPAKKYTAKIFKPGINAEGKYFMDCIDFLKDTGHFYGNAQGLTLIYEISKSFFPIDVHVWSPDEKDSLPIKKDIHRIPRIKICENGQAELDPYSSHTSLSRKGNMYILAFTKREL